jgi:hypothetical protein
VFLPPMHRCSLRRHRGNPVVRRSAAGTSMTCYCPLHDLYAALSSPTLLRIARMRELAPPRVEHHYSPQPITRR